MKLPPKLIAKFVQFNEAAGDTFNVVGGIGCRRSGHVGRFIGTIGLRHANGYEIVLQFPDGKMDTFAPHDLFPAEEAQFKAADTNLFGGAKAMAEQWG
jgi:hypothetical protein